MKIKRIILLIIVAFTVCTVLALFAFRLESKAEIDLIAVNDVEQSFVEQWDKIDQNKLPGLQYGIDYVVINNNGSVVAATRTGLNKDINTALMHRDTIVNITKDQKQLGKLIVYNDSSDKFEKYRRELLIFVLFILVIVTLLCIIFATYYDRTLFKPFRKLQSFARHITEGNLDIPLEMDKGNLFGAFTESFDLMRDEIKRARNNERMANQSKKELVASLSHDIKTPVASIKAVSELIYASTTNDALKNQIEMIDSKADQINTLITNLFNATLEELQELKVNATEQSSQLLYDLIYKADYNHLVTIHHIKECLILIDDLRLSQVIDNVLSNSYKYAGTAIDVSSNIKGRYLEIYLKDYGKGVSEEEKPLIFNKFYRAKNATGKNGTGLGLYISRYLMRQMSGEIDCENSEDGFLVKLKLKIV
jgi:Signal transduction histidine kinase